MDWATLPAQLRHTIATCRTIADLQKRLASFQKPVARRFSIVE